MDNKTRCEINQRNAAKARGSLGGVFWTDERIALLKKMWARNALVFDIADAMGGGCTRNMVIGKAHRLRLGPIKPNKRRWSERNSQEQFRRHRERVAA